MYKIVRCPVCGEKEAYVYDENVKEAIEKGFPIFVHCNRLNKCGEVTKMTLQEANETNLFGEIIEEDVTVLEQRKQKMIENKKITPKGREILKNLFLLSDCVTFWGGVGDYRGLTQETLLENEVVYYRREWINLLNTSKYDFGKQYFSQSYEKRNVLIPVYDYEGELVRVLLRNLKNELPVKEIQCVIEQGSVEIFNLKRLKEQDKDICFVCEGAFDALSVIQESSKNITAVGLPGVSKWKQLLNLLVEKDDEQLKQKTYVIAFDNDEIGHKERFRCMEAFDDAGFKVLGYAPDDYKDCNEYLQKDKVGFANSLKDF